MIKHIVLFKFFENKKESDTKILMDKLMKLPEKIDLIRSYEVGANIIEGPRNYDVSLIATFDTLEDLKVYGKTEPHIEFLKYMDTVVIDVKVLDYEF
ncbi:MAG: Dabb family protein [Firmicutes bacterium]|nr:Dabb family protein [Bacillota bacterium]